MLKNRNLVRAVALCIALSVFPAVSFAHEYDRDDDGNPWRVAAYLLHPFGMALEYYVVRPLHWVVSQPKWDKIFGHEPTEHDGDFFEFK